MNLDYPHNADPFTETDPARVAEHRAWAHSALDALIDYRLEWEADGQGGKQPYHSGQINFAETDDGATQLFATALVFACKLVGRRAHSFNAEWFHEGDPPEMRAALRRLIHKMAFIWPSAPAAVSSVSQRRSIWSRDLVNALSELDKGHTPDLCITGAGRESDLLKEQCRFAGALWSIHLKASGVRRYTAPVVSAFGLGNDGQKAVQRWKSALDDPQCYARKLGYDDELRVTSLIARANLVHDSEAIRRFGSYLAFNVFGALNPSPTTLAEVGARYQALLVKSG